MASIVTKLHIKPGVKLALLNAPVRQAKMFSDVADECSVSRSATGKPDVVLLFVSTMKELDRKFPAALRLAKDDVPLWIGYPKQTGAVKSDLSRDRVWEHVSASGVRPVSIVALDNTWSLLRVRRKELVKSTR